MNNIDLYTGNEYVQKTTKEQMRIIKNEDKSRSIEDMRLSSKISPPFTEKGDTERRPRLWFKH